MKASPLIVIVVLDLVMNVAGNMVTIVVCRFTYVNCDMFYKQ